MLYSTCWFSMWYHSDSALIRDFCGTQCRSSGSVGQSLPLVKVVWSRPSIVLSVYGSQDELGLSCIRVHQRNKWWHRRDWWQPVISNTRHIFTVSAIDLEKLLNDLSHSKTSRPDLELLPTRMVSKEIAPALHVCAIYQQSYNTGQVPLDLQQAKVTAVFKKGDKSNPANYPSGTWHESDVI